MYSEIESDFWVNIEKYRSKKHQILLRTQKQYPAGPIETGVHQARFGKAKNFSQQN